MENINLKDFLIHTVTEYAKAKAEPYVEKGVTKVGYIIGIVVSALFLLAAFLMFFVFSGISLAVFLGEYLKSQYQGFLVVTILYLFLGWFIWMMRKRIVGKIIGRIMLKELKENMGGFSHS